MAQAQANGAFAWALYRVHHDGAYSHVVIRQAIQRDGRLPKRARGSLRVDLGSRLRGLAREEDADLLP